MEKSTHKQPVNQDKYSPTDLHQAPAPKTDNAEAAKRQLVQTYKLGFGSSVNFGLSNSFMVIAQGICFKMTRTAQGTKTSFTPIPKKPNPLDVEVLTSQKGGKGRTVLLNQLTEKNALSFAYDSAKKLYRVRNEEVSPVEIGQISVTQKNKLRTFTFSQGTLKVSHMDFSVPSGGRGMCICSGSTPLTSFEPQGSFSQPISISEKPPASKNPNDYQCEVKYAGKSSPQLIDVLSIISILQVFSLELD